MDQELVQYLDERFHGLDQRFDRIDQRFEEVDRRFDEVNERIDEAKRHSGVLIEGLRHELHLVAEGLLTHIDVRHAEDRTYVDQRFQETNALVRLSLESTEQLRHRVENLERNQQN
jgi:chaperonin cofactor prefoldin